MKPIVGFQALTSYLQAIGLQRPQNHYLATNSRLNFLTLKLIQLTGNSFGSPSKNFWRFEEWFCLASTEFIVVYLPADRASLQPCLLELYHHHSQLLKRTTLATWSVRALQGVPIKCSLFHRPVAT